MKNALQYIKNLLIGNRILIIFLVMATLSFIILFFVIAQNSSNQSSTESTIDSPVYGINTNAENLAELNLSASDTADILAQIQRIVKKNDSNEIVEATDIHLRKNSIKIKDFSDTDLTSGYINMIVDIPKVKQSYRVVFSIAAKGDEDSDSTQKDTPSYVSCIYDSSKIKYKDFSCKDNFGKDQKYGTLNYYSERSNVNNARLYLYEDTHELYVDVTSYGGSDEQAIEDAKKWVKSMGYSTDGIEFITEIAGGAPPQEQPGGVPNSPDN